MIIYLAKLDAPNLQLKISPMKKWAECQGSNSRVRLNITAEEFEFMHKIAQESPQLKPAIFYDQFIEKYPATALTVGQVKTKFSAVKSSNKR